MQVMLKIPIGIGPNIMAIKPVDVASIATMTEGLVFVMVAVTASGSEVL